MILDGATGTELHRRGIDIGLPLWSANALLTDAGLDTLRQIHLDYLKAGADILTANTFRTHRRALAALAPLASGASAASKGYDTRELTKRAVQTAREAISVETRHVASLREKGARYVAGSISPLEDCYSPQLVPSDAECRAEHSERIHHLVEAGVDILLIETMNTIREAAIAARLAVITGLPTFVSFVCDRNGRLLSGESFTTAAEVLLPIGIAALGVNCGPTPVLARPLAELRAACLLVGQGSANFPLIAYGNTGYTDEKTGWVNTEAIDPAVYARYAKTWPAQIIGGCCGTTPEHIRQLAKALW